MSMSPWDVTSALFNRVSFRDMSFADKLELYFSDFSLIPLMIQARCHSCDILNLTCGICQENYIKMDPALAAEANNTKSTKDIEVLTCLSHAADSIASADIISNV